MMKSRIAEDSATNRSLPGKLIALLSIVALAMMSLGVYLIWSGYQQEMRDGETTTRNYAAILEARLGATLRRVDADLWELAHTIPVAALSRQAEPRYARETNADLSLHLFNFKEIAGFSVADRNGDTLYSSTSPSTPRVNVSDNSYFRLLRDNPQAGLVFSEVITSRNANRQALVMARALRDGRGGFIGVVFASLELEYFQALFRSLNIGSQGVISLFRSDDNRLVLRWPHLADAVNRARTAQSPIVMRMAAGDRAATLQFVAQNDGVERIYSYQALADYPFDVDVGFGRDDLLANWRTHSLAIGVLGLSLLGLLAGLLFRLWRAVARETVVMAELKENEQALRDSAENLRLFADNVPAMTISLDDKLRIFFANKRYADFFGFDPADIVGRYLREVVGEDAYGEVEGYFAQVLQGHPVTYQRTHKLPGGESRYLEVKLLPHIGDQGKVLGCYAVTADISAHKKAEQALRDSAEKLRLFADNVPAITVSWDENLCCRFANKAFAVVFGLAVEDVIGKHLWELYGAEVYREVEGHFAQVLRGHPVTYQRTHKLPSGESRYLEVKLLPHIGDQGKVQGCYAVTTDITEHKLAQERIQRVAHHDSLTGLPNRMLFNDRLGQAISLARRDSRQFALFYLDLDKFKAVNDTAGHTAGDELLQAVAARIRREVRESDTVARVGGDEFTVILPGITRREEAETVARKIIAALVAPFQLDSQTQSVDIGTSIGIALYPSDAQDADALIKAADAAMYGAKQARSGYRFFGA